jgi:hypothetical protein
MQLACPNCGHPIRSPGKDQLFCAFCGHRLPPALLQSTTEQTQASEPATLPPAPPAAAATGEEPQEVGGYRLLRRLGGGGMGTVYEAEDCSSGRRVALKLIAADFAQSDDAVERFRREGRLASAIAHPRCVFVLAADEEAGRPYIVMELMPGATLADLLKEQGRLAPQDAVAKVLDVIAGLQEAHRLGVIHRDVKPANCFVDAEGRVKVGDFGLSKSLVGDARLTKTGLFLGTPLFASPEQVRGERVDAQSDLYSLAATLYCLLTGRAPFEGGDLAATLARIAADPAPSLRKRCPELPAELDRVVLRGLERDRQRRWRDLEQLKQALLPFLPGRHAAASRGARFGATVIDYILLQVLALLILGAFTLTTGVDREAFSDTQGYLAATALWLLYFGLAEWLWGCTAGKWLLGLRVCPLARTEPPGLGRTLVRFLVFYLLTNLGNLAWLLMFPLTNRLDSISPGDIWLGLLLALAILGLQVLGFGLMLSTMRRRNGWRGLHEFVSGTRVIQRPKAQRRWALGRRTLGDDVTRPRELPEQIGPYKVQGALRWQDQAKVLLGEERGLGRQVLLWLRPAPAAPLPSARRECSRTTRLRWLAGGRQDDWQWDAFLTPSGLPLADLVAAEGRLPWPMVRLILEQLTEELAVAAAEATLPEPLSVGQVWVRFDGGVELLDVPLGQEQGAGRAALPSQPALAVLAQTAVLALEGHPRWVTGPIRAPVPRHATRFLERLLGQGRPYQDVREFQAQLETTRDRPAEITQGRRAAHVGVLTVLLSVGLFCMMMASGLLVGVERLSLRSTSLKVSRWEFQHLEAHAARNFAGRILNPQPLARLAAVHQLRADLKRCDQLREQLEKDERKLLVGLQVANTWTRRFFHSREQWGWAEDPLSQADWERLDAEGWQHHVNRRANSLTVTWERLDAQGVERDQIRLLLGDEEEAGLVAIILLTIWPALWVVAAFLFRGGLSYWMLGLLLVCPEGRRAGRFRCTWRALLVWGPWTALLAAALGLDMWHWYFSQAHHPQPWAFWLSELLHWVSLGLLLTYPVLLICLPWRSLHDRLAGTYLVPR